MSGYSLSIRPSRLRQQALLLLAILLAWLALSWPLAGAKVFWVWLVFSGWFTVWYLAWCQAAPPPVLFLKSNGELRWLDDRLPPGQIHWHSRISPVCIFLCWQDTFGTLRRQWLFSDQLSSDDYRAVARVIKTLSWQRMAAR